MRSRSLLLLGTTPLLLAQSQPTFYAAWEDGRDAEHQGRWQAALGAYRRAVALRPMPAVRVIIYGNNLLKDYFPYTRMARCHLELGELEAAEASLGRGEAQAEPLGERQALLRRLRELRAARLGPVSRLPTTAPAESPTRGSAAPPPSPVLPALQAEAAPVPQGLPLGQTPAKPSAPPSKTQARAVPAPVTTLPAAPPVPPQRRGRSRWPLGIALCASLGGLLLLVRWLGRRKAGLRLSAFETPEHIGPYRLERLLGRGGFASTYLARHSQTGQLVALKLLHPYRQDDPEFLGRFRQEARLGRLLDHPNLVHLVDPGPSIGSPWLAMEYVDGQRMDQFLRERGPLPVAEILRLGRALASAMAYAHAHGVVHRDLKPGNVMLLDGQVKVMDFGIARTMDSQTLTTTYAFLGTPLYAAPEVQFKSQVGPAADGYSLGIMLFEMLAGHPPFTGETPFEILDQHRAAPFPDLRALRPDAPEVLVRLLERLCAKQPEERPEDMEVFETLEGLG